MKRIIINADDFGINDVVTSEIERMIQAGAVSSTTIMANGFCLEEVRRFAANHCEASYGIHLCLSEFESLTKSDVLKQTGIINEKGIFVKQAIFKVKCLDKHDVQKAIKDELNAQIDVVSTLGILISHADSHHHVHTIYPLRDLFNQVLHDRNIRKIRIGADFRTLRMKIHFGLWYQRVLLNSFYKRHFTTTDSFYTYSKFINSGCPMKDGEVIELMCHPGHPSQLYKEEMALVESKGLLNQLGIKAISYNDI